ncbi:hypothetical protein ACFQY4_26195 [Catellatospora bangladeshensis]|uniref:Uncharacterized protein n=1 Tax=Catellatospora bangladeshensis TaxID=310355 RepID=A0A8J3JSD4_9ACTN|nr:hypothetical protein [Catellatospora bangladeshensis]GIF86047.1 hypothetical protein Cba03nite_73960 [Catellatospora bangladeshensis]
MRRPLELMTPPIGTLAPCLACDRQATWDEIHGWVHTIDVADILSGAAMSAHSSHVAAAEWPQR